MSEHLVGKRAILAGEIAPGTGKAFEVEPDDLVQISTLNGKQVADFVAFASGDSSEYLSTAVTRSKNANIMLRPGMGLYSNRRNLMFTIVDDLVGRHDMMFAACDSRRYSEDFGIEGHTNCKEALTAALGDRVSGQDGIPDPINWFMNVAILQKGELEPRESLAERNDYVLLKSAANSVLAVSACPQDQTAINNFAPTSIMVRVFR